MRWLTGALCVALIVGSLTGTEVVYGSPPPPKPQPKKVRAGQKTLRLPKRTLPKKVYIQVEWDENGDVVWPETRSHPIGYAGKTRYRGL